MTTGPHRRPPRNWRDRLGPLAREALDTATEHGRAGWPSVERWLSDATTRLEQWREARREAARRVARPTRLLWILPLPLIPAAALALAGGDLGVALADAAAYALVVAGTLLGRRGLAAEAALHDQVFQAPPPPRKLSGWLMVGAGTALAAGLGAGHDVATALVFGLGAAGGCALAYGLDPRPSATLATGASARVGAALERAEQQIIAIESARDRLGNPELTARLGRIAAVARQILGHLAADPNDMRRARRFLVTYLEGAQRVVTGYARSHPHDTAGALEESFRRVLETIEDTFTEQHRRLQQRDIQDLDIQIEVLAQQMRREGLD